MASGSYIFITMLALGNAADDMAWGGVSGDGAHGTWGLDLAVATARGIDNLFIANPMDAHDWSHTSIIRKSLAAQQNGTAPKVKKLEQELKDLFKVMPKDGNGRLDSATARYALHRHYTKKHGWTIKGLDAPGAAWMSTMSVTPDVKDITKYMVPAYLQQLLLKQMGVQGFDLHNLAILGAAIEHMIHAEMIGYVTAIFKAHGVPVAGRKTEKQIDDVLETFMMVFALGINLDVSTAEDLQKAGEYLTKSHAAWPQLKDFAKKVKETVPKRERADFFGVVKVVERISEAYSTWQGGDCPRAKEKLMAMPSYHDGRVKLENVQASHSLGRRSLFTENFETLLKQGVLASQGAQRLLNDAHYRAHAELVIPNYLNSQSMCLSTASMFTVCCVNECDTLLSGLEGEVGAPSAERSQIARWAQTVPGNHAVDPALPHLVASHGAIDLHSREFAQWMHDAFPLTCPVPATAHGAAHPKTPSEWIGRNEHLAVKDLEDTIMEVAEVLTRYTTMGKALGEKASKPASNTDQAAAWAKAQQGSNVVPIKPQPSASMSDSNVLTGVLRMMPLIPMVGFVWVAAKRLFQASCLVTCGGTKLLKKYQEHVV